jgi:hypothetical protein
MHQFLRKHAVFLIPFFCIFEGDHAAFKNKKSAIKPIITDLLGVDYQGLIL